MFAKSMQKRLLLCTTLGPERACSHPPVSGRDPFVLGRWRLASLSCPLQASCDLTGWDYKNHPLPFLKHPAPPTPPGNYSVMTREPGVLSTPI